MAPYRRTQYCNMAVYSSLLSVFLHRPFAPPVTLYVGLIPVRLWAYMLIPSVRKSDHLLPWTVDIGSIAINIAIKTHPEPGRGPAKADYSKTVSQNKQNPTSGALSWVPDQLPPILEGSHVHLSTVSVPWWFFYYCWALTIKELLVPVPASRICISSNLVSASHISCAVNRYLTNPIEDVIGICQIFRAEQWLFDFSDSFLILR